MNGTSLQGIDQTALYYAPMGLDHSQYPYALAGALNGLVPNGLDYSSQNVSPHEGLIGSNGASPGSSGSVAAGVQQIGKSITHQNRTLRQQSHPYARPQGGLN